MEENAKNKQWSLLMVRECGGRCSMSGQWEKLTQAGKVRSRKRKRISSSEEEIANIDASLGSNPATRALKKNKLTESNIIWDRRIF